MSESTLFTDAMALTFVGDGRYDGELNEHWTIGPKGSGPKVHGGAMLALCANAARLEHSSGSRRWAHARSAGDDSGGARDEGAWPIAISGNFLWAPDPGPMRVVTTVVKRGRRVSLIDVELTQGDRTAVRAAVTMGEPEHHVPPLLSVNRVLPLMTPEPPPDLEPIGPGHPMAAVVNLAHGCDIRPSLTTMAPPADGGPPGTQGAQAAPVIEYWVRPKGVAPDPLFALM
ncbi:MAG: thioesterase family protein, partial [Mycobacterium sp.]